MPSRRCRSRSTTRLPGQPSARRTSIDRSISQPWRSQRSRSSGRSLDAMRDRWANVRRCSVRSGRSSPVSRTISTCWTLARRSRRRLAIDALDARDVPEARKQATTLAAIADELGDDEWRMVAAWKAGLADVIDGDVQAGLARVGDLAYEAERQGWEGSGVTAFREASSVAASALDYRAAVHWIDAGVRYSDSIEQSHCAHVMRSTLAVVSWAGADPADAQSRARQAIVDKGCPRGATIAHWALGYVAMTQGDLAGGDRASSADALALGESSGEIELILPPLWGLAEVALQAGDPDRAFALCRDALARCAAVGERILLTPFVVTGVRAAQAGRPTCRGRDLAGRVCRAPREDPGCRRRGARPRTGAGRAGGRRDRRRAPRARGGGRWLGPPRSLVGGDPGAARPGPVPGPLEPLRGGRQPRIGGRRVGRPSRFEACSPIGPRRSCGWPAGTPRTTSRGARSPRASSRSRGSSARA